MARFFDYDASRAALFQPCRAPFFDGWRPATPAALCSELARLAYCRGQAVRIALAAVSLQLVGEVDEANGRGTYAFLARGDEVAVLAFRGTQPDDPTDIIDDVRFLPVPWSAGGLVHVGFAEALLRVWPTLATLVAAVDRPLLITGHSLGGALATLAATLVSPQQLITFGSPRVGDAEFCRLVSGRVAVERYVDCCDVVCQIPPPGLYHHVGRLNYLDRGGDLHVDPPGWLMAGDQAAGHLDYVREYAWRPGMVASRSLADHAPINYVSAVVGASS